MKRYYYKVVSLLMLVFLLAGCEKFINVEPKDSLSGNNFWNDAADAETFTLDIYRLFREATLLKGPYFIMGELRNNMVTRTGSFPNRLDIGYLAQGQIRTLAYTPRAKPGEDANRFWQHNVEWDILSNWKPYYKVIQSSNVLFENVVRLADNDKSVSPAVIKKYQAEAVFMRCMSYFFLIRLFGDVPYYTNAYNDKPLPRISHLTIAKNCLEELAAIKEDLPWTYEEPANRGVRAMRGSAITLMMHLNMWLAGFDQGNAQRYYQQVDDLGDELTEIGEKQNNAYELLPLSRMKEIFQGRSKESFFEISNSVNYQGFVSANSRKMMPFYVLDGYTVRLNQDRDNAELAYLPQHIEKLYPEGVNDGRIEAWFDQDNWKSGGGKFRFFKFVNFEYGGANQAENYANSIIVFRYAETLLLQAEAAQGLKNDDKAVALLNRVRARAEAALYPENGYDSLSEAIFYERGKELMGEGFYFFDLVRTRRIMSGDFTLAPMSFTAFNAGAWTWPINVDAQRDNPLISLNYWNQ